MIIQQPDDSTSPVGDNVVFSCVASGQTNPTIQWFKDGVILDVGNRLMITEMIQIDDSIRSDLSIIDLILDDDGNYSCIATSNGESDISRNAILSVLCKFMCLITFYQVWLIL